MSGCILRFTRNSPVRTTLVDEGTGLIKYKIETPVKIAGSVTRIRKIESPVVWKEEADDSDSSDDDVADDGKKSDLAKEGDEVDPVELPETSDEMARIYWKWFSSNKVIFKGKTTTRDELLAKCGKLKGSFTFTGPDGVKYRWAMGAMGLNSPKLMTADEKTVIAEFHRVHLFDKKEKARIEVHSAGMSMLDHIVLTFVFVGQARREREVAVRSTVPFNWLVG